ncbi:MULTISPECIES: prolipoprotein diacylglyceryl transferase [Janthinobacterium]|uniref:Phosphatidylglycerol--prolipoprotein diacylglyceryl transferase n=1 Tax=Janthinobacterium violaceinigrum TaxID=2654252 RepID=A0A6I1I2V7_9BURK|nr:MULTISPECIES: prolipoprotein diacylglyceryl transferase [Janthinobacterium]KAB8063909.1 prolipoprotein diacylglyceryl transferase [Janthinobacterium violaceinigrum]MDN2670404.1 prolipoprotein diacylglyceryl transferase [Janthinobacterium sp. SUN026]MDN2702556.1 prolipoprotein diacylglyceryl transferase [Janthinobacterium sp. SUN100]MDN2716008.1 prolipoprotein diacylglyceryl transferase [Janthinobacterium sp. SUN120]MDO8038242.1 prolipoprotein diacylglyceryl transferase [Janthinobacterium sp
MLIHPMPDPIAIQIGPLAVHWYGLMYVLAFALFIILGRVRIKQPHIAVLGWKKEDLDDMLFYGMLGVVIGGRLGEVLFYRPEYFMHNPLEIFMVWHGGMSFHGGFLGVILAMYLWSRKAGRNLFDVLDFIAPLVPLGYAAGRLGNFINAELPGRIAPDTLPWAMQWPGIPYPVHPSPIYQMLVDGILVFIILWLYARKQRPRMAVGAMFTLLYGCARFFTEYFRTPDWEVVWLGVPITSGQMLSLPMIVGAIALLVWAYKSQVMGTPPTKARPANT